jgi:hypothetical protein
MLAMLAISSIMGCKRIDAGEAEALFTAVYKPLSALRDEALGQDAVDIEITLGTGWEGLATAAGTPTLDGTIIVYPLQVLLEEVYVLEEDLTMSGTLSMGVAHDIDQADGQSYHLETTVDGALSVSGDAKGLADLAFSFTEVYDYDANRLTFSAAGEISGQDVSGFTNGGLP